MHRLDPMSNSLGQAANLAQKAVGETRRVADHLYRTGEEMRDELQCRLEAAREDIQQMADCIKDKANKLTEVVTMAINNTHEGEKNTQTLVTGGPCTLTYVDAINTGLPTSHLNTMAKTWIRAKQVLIDKDLE